MSRKESAEDELARLARLLSHRVRVQILDLLHERDASASDLTPEIGEPLGTVAYHFKLLADSGALELRGTRQVRGAIERTFGLSRQTRKDLDGLTAWLDKRRRVAPARKPAKAGAKKSDSRAGSRA
jgi:DNA-binding transcriptional ArsR family regulator